MSTIEIQKGIKISVEELLTGMAQMDISTLEKFSDEINRLIARRKASSPSEKELALIKIVYQPLEATIQQRYDELSVKNKKGTISEEEHAELLKLVELAENHNVKWLEALVELAQLRGVSLEVVKKQLGVKNPV